MWFVLPLQGCYNLDSLSALEATTGRSVLIQPFQGYVLSGKDQRWGVPRDIFKRRRCKSTDRRKYDSVNPFRVVVISGKFLVLRFNPFRVMNSLIKFIAGVCREIFLRERDAID